MVKQRQVASVVIKCERQKLLEIVQPVKRCSIQPSQATQKPLLQTIARCVINTVWQALKCGPPLVAHFILMLITAVSVQHIPLPLSFF